MKIRNGFVSNSSSSSFLIAFHREEIFDIYEFFNKCQDGTLPDNLYLYDPAGFGRSGDCAEVVFEVTEGIKQYILDNINDFMQNYDNIRFFPTIDAMYEDDCGYFPFEKLKGSFDVKWFNRDYCTVDLGDFKNQYSF